MIELQEYTDTDGRSPFADWFNDLDAPAAAKVATALVRVEQGNFSNAKRVGAGVLEYRVDFGPGYRVYFGKVENDIDPQFQRNREGPYRA